MFGLTSLSRFRDDEFGGGTAWNLFWCITFIILGGLAVDTANAYRVKIHLQSTADSAALAAVAAYRRAAVYEEFMGVEDAPASAEARGRQAAIAMARKIMPPAVHGQVLKEADITFGTWTSGSFTEGAGSAARVRTRRTEAQGNKVGTYLLRVMGTFNSWDIEAESIAEAYVGACARDGVITSDVIDFQSNSDFTNGICLHGSGGVEVNQNNYYEPGVIVSMEDLDDLVVPGDDLSKNLGLAEALRTGNVTPHLANAVEEIIADLLAVNSGADLLDLEFLPQAVQAAASDGTAQIVTRTPSGSLLTNQNFDQVALTPGNVYKVFCTGGNSTLDLRGTGQVAWLDGPVTDIRFAAAGGGTVEPEQSFIEGVVIVTDCDVTFSQDTVIRDAVVATSSTSDMSVKGSSGVMIGDPDNCAAGGGAQILTAGGMHFAAQMQFHGSQLVAAGPVSISSQVDGFAGTSIQSRSRVDFASNNAIGLCQGTADQVLPVGTYRLVQ